MATRHITPPWQFLRQASNRSLESYELSRLNDAASLRREIAALLDQWIEDNSEALLARWMRDCPQSEVPPTGEMPQQELLFADPPAIAAVQESKPSRIMRHTRRNPHV